MNMRTEVMSAVDARRSVTAAAPGGWVEVDPLPTPVISLHRFADEPTPLFAEVAGEHQEHILQLLTSRAPTVEEILAASPTRPRRRRGKRKAAR